MHKQITETLQRPDYNMNTIVNLTTLNVIVKLYNFCGFFFFQFFSFNSFIMLLRIILCENDIRRVTIDNLPETVDAFCSILKTKLGLEGDLVIQYQDPEFDNELCNLSSMSELPKDNATLKVHTKCSESYHTDSTLNTASLSSSSLEERLSGTQTRSQRG